jgi:hypothetical protein
MGGREPFVRTAQTVWSKSSKGPESIDGHFWHWEQDELARSMDGWRRRSASSTRMLPACHQPKGKGFEDSSFRTRGVMRAVSSETCSGTGKYLLIRSKHEHSHRRAYSQSSCKGGRSRRRGGTGSIDALPLRRRSGYCDTLPSQPSSHQPARGPGSGRGPIRVANRPPGRFRCGLVEDHSGRRTDEHPMAILARKIPLTLDGAVILSGGILQLHSDPVPGGKMSGPDEAYYRRASVLKFDGLADLKIRYIDHSSNFRPRPSIRDSE